MKVTLRGRSRNVISYSLLNKPRQLRPVWGLFIFMRVFKPIDFIPDGSNLKFIKQIENSIHKKVPIALYMCKCGVLKEIRVQNVKCGNTTSCGCVMISRVKKANTKHGFHSHPLYFIWTSMISRCYNVNHKKYRLYGGRGITVCDEWKNDFTKFYDWCINNGWVKKLVIDKDLKAKKLGIPPTEYSPQTCSILTVRDNSRARTDRKTLTFNGETKITIEWANQIGVSENTLRRRIKLWGLELAMTTPKLVNKRFFN